ncbi:unnamed protein product, partial [Didymodactylos carnosus]
MQTTSQARFNAFIESKCNGRALTR